MKVVTHDAVYKVKPKDGYLKIITPDGEKVKGVAVYPDRLPYMMATTKVEALADGQSQGYNSKGTKTLRVVPDKVEEGMVLANRGGFVTSRIKEVIY